MSRLKKIKVNGVTLAYKEFGTGDKYLLSTQNFFLTGCHEELLGKAPYDYHVFLVYMRGYGESDHIFSEEPTDYTKIWGEDLIAFAEAMGIVNFYYTGVSHGNWAGWYIAFHRPELLKGFVCCDGIVQFREPGSISARPKYLEEIDDIVGNYEELNKIAWQEHWPTNNPDRLAKREANHKEHIQILMTRKREEFSVLNTNMMACEVNSEDDLYSLMSKIECPVLIWQGGLDPLAKSEDALKIAQTIPGAVLINYQHLGHGGADECPELAARDCDRFFKDTEGRIL